MGDEPQLTLRGYLLFRDGLLEEREHSLVEQKALTAVAVKRLETRVRGLFSIHDRPNSGRKPDEQSSLPQCQPPARVAEYIDNSLSKEQIGLFEINCLESDELLTEVTECHRMLAVMRHDHSLQRSLPTDHANRIHELIQEKITRSTSKVVATGQPNLAGDSEVPTAEPVSINQTKHNKWIIKRGEHKSRPIEVEALRNQAINGELAPTDLLWKYGGEDWILAADLAENLQLEFQGAIPPNRQANAPRNLYKQLRQKRWRLSIAIGLCLPLLQAVFSAPAKTRPAQIRYVDGSLLPLEQLLIRFHPLARPLHAKTTPPPAEVLIDPTSGDFQIPPHVAEEITPHRPSHRVTLHRPDGKPLPGNLVSPDYSASHKTPLQIHADGTDTISLILMTPNSPDEKHRNDLE